MPSKAVSAHRIDRSGAVIQQNQVDFSAQYEPSLQLSKLSEDAKWSEQKSLDFPVLGRVR
jgi:hypothetical protein